MMDDTILELGLRSRPPADPVYRSRITAMSPMAPQTSTQPRRQAEGRPRPMSAVARLVAAIALVTMGAGAVFLAASTGPTEPPAPSPSPTALPLPTLLPAIIPADVPSGLVETPIGSARWVHLSGDPSSIRGPLWPMPGPSGLLWWDGGERGPVPCEDPQETECGPQLWASADAISERVELTLPVESRRASLVAQEGTWWLVTAEPTTLWRTTDVERWEQIDLGALVSPGPTELDWEVSLGAPATSGGRTVIPVSYRALDAGRLLGRPDTRSAWPEPRDGGFRIIEDSQGAAQDAGEVGIEETSSGLRFSDTEGNTLATLEGVGMEFVDAWSQNWAIVEHQVALVDGGVVTPATLPGARLSGEYGWPGPTAFGTGSGFLAYGPTPDGTTRTWHSPDGREWVEGDRLGDADGEPQGVDVVGVRAGWGRPAAVVVLRFGGPAWESTDGTSWTALASDIVPMRVRDAWLRWDTDTGWFTSRDGATWEQATELNRAVPKWTTVSGGGAGVRGVIGDTVFYAVNEEDGARRRDLWIVEFEWAPE